MSEAPEFVVLTEGEGMHLVCLRWSGGKPWLRVLAVFADKARAESYAEFENTMEASDMSSTFGDEVYQAPKIELPKSAIDAALDRRVIEQRTLQEAPAMRSVPAGLVEQLDEIKAGALPFESQPAPSAPADEEAGVALPQPSAVSRDAPPARAPTDDAAVVKARVAELWKNDKPLRVIAEEVGVSESRVGQIKRELGLPNRDHLTGRPPALLVEWSGIKLDLNRNTIALGDRKMALNLSQTALLAALFRADGHPVGDDFLIRKIYPGKKQEAVQHAFDTICRDLTNGLPAIGVTLRNIKGVGLKLEVSP